jgi:hypothetical protein
MMMGNLRIAAALKANKTLELFTIHCNDGNHECVPLLKSLTSHTRLSNITVLEAGHGYAAA